MHGGKEGKGNGNIYLHKYLKTRTQISIKAFIHNCQKVENYLLADE